MVKSFAALLVLLLTACATSGVAPAQRSDEALRKLIVGGWIVSVESEDYLPGFSETLWEEFRADGAEILHVYEDETCTKEVETTVARWRIADGILITSYDDGSSDRDQIISINENWMKLGFEDGTTGTMTRADRCGDRGSI